MVQTILSDFMKFFLPKVGYIWQQIFKNMNRFRIFLFFFLILSTTAFSIESGIPDENQLKQMKVDNMTDEQLIEFQDRLKSSGSSFEQFEKVAILRGAQSSEIQKLKFRLNNLSSQGSKKKQNQETKNRLREEGEEQKADTTLEKTKEIQDLKYLNKLYGFELFNTKQLTFEPSFNIPTPENYQIGPGDQLLIDVWGASMANYNLKVTPEGNIFIDNLGPVNVNGLTIDKANLRLKQKLSTIYSGLTSSSPNTFLQVNIGNVRSIKVNLVGEVFNPGTYTLPSLATVFNAIYYAGGPSRNGSLRNIEVFRESKKVSTLDVYEFLVNGDQKNNIRLQDQDVIKINPYQNRVEIEGEIKRAAIYDLKVEESLSDLIRFAGGYTENAYTFRHLIIRNTDKERKVEDIAKSQLSKFQLKNGDFISVDRILDRFTNKIEISGAVYRPGVYSLDSVEFLKDLILKADGLRGDAFTNRANIVRLRDDLTTEILSIPLNDQLLEASRFQLKKDDIVKIYSINELSEEFKLTIEGEVRRPGNYPFTYNTTLEDLIASSGGFLVSASEARIEVSRRLKNSSYQKGDQVAEIFYFNVNRDLRLNDSTSKFKLEPFDIIFVRRSPGYQVQKNVSIDGEVLFPGNYTLTNKLETISDLISRSGGLTNEAYVKGAKLIRRLNPEVDQAHDEALKNMKKLSKDLIDLETEESSEVKEQAIGIDLERIMKSPKSKYDIILEENDMLVIPRELQTVRLNGALLYPITVRYDKGYGFRRYINMAGGFAEEARGSKSFVIYANGTVKSTKNFLFFRIYPSIEPGAEIVVPMKPEKEKISAQETVGLTTAIASTALIVVTIVNALK